MPEPFRPTGAIPTPRHKLAASVPYRIVGATPPQFAIVPKVLSYWNNQNFGCCVTTEEAFAKACYSPEIFITDATVLSWAQAHGVLNGAEILQVVQWMQTDGFHQDGTVYNDGPPLAVDYANPAVLTNAISQGPVKLGVAARQLQGAVGMGNGWFATGFGADQKLDHCVGLSGYGPMSWLAGQLGVGVPASVDGTQPGYLLFTWDTIGVIDVPSMLAITGEAWLRNPTTVIPGPTPPPPTPPPSPPPPRPSPCRRALIEFVSGCMRAARELGFEV